MCFVFFKNTLFFSQILKPQRFFPVFISEGLFKKGLKKMDDKQILDLYINRSEKAIEETDAKYGSYCRKISMNILQNIQDSEETVNDTWLKAWNTIPPKMPNPLKTYLGRITRNLSLNRYEYYRAQKRNSHFDIILSEVEQMIPLGAGSDEYESGEISQAINAFLGELKKENRIYFVRRYWYSDSIADIAEKYGVSEGKIKSSLFRTRTALRNYLGKEGISI